MHMERYETRFFTRNSFQKSKCSKNQATHGLFGPRAALRGEEGWSGSSFRPASNPYWLLDQDPTLPDSKPSAKTTELVAVQMPPLKPTSTFETLAVASHRIWPKEAGASRMTGAVGR